MLMSGWLTMSSCRALGQPEQKQDGPVNIRELKVKWEAGILLAHFFVFHRQVTDAKWVSP